ncbi:hypothetical protein V6B95_13970 [Thermoanaerobacterium saccharolyticum]|uniref:hypothetical protein n=1 Tax=Thermoanaerobacterium saccharolyticum TaxID=28896 RepID=UPI002FD9D5A1
MRNKEAHGGQVWCESDIDIVSLIHEIENLIDNGKFIEALDMLKKSKINLDDPRFYLLYYKIYDGLGDKEMSNKFLKAYKIFNEN